MKAQTFIAGLVLIAAAACPAAAQERIVVTGSRIAEQLGSSSSSYAFPHVGLTRRPDYLLRTLTVSCDTREAGARADELRRTLRGMLNRAERDDSIELSRIVEIGDNDGYGYREELDVVVEPFTDAAIDGGFRANFRGRADTSYIELQIKTPIGDDDTLDAAAGRLESFVEGVDRVGRSELDLSSADLFSIVDPQDYRDDIFAAMAEDANARAAALGENYRARFEGMEHQVYWYRSGVLELTLFIPHRMTIVPSDE